MTDEYIHNWTIHSVLAINKMFSVLHKVYNANPDLREEIDAAFKALNIMCETLAPKWENLNGWKAREELRKLTWDELEPHRRSGNSLFQSVSVVFGDKETARALFADVRASLDQPEPEL